MKNKLSIDISPIEIIVFLVSFVMAWHSVKALGYFFGDEDPTRYLYAIAVEGTVLLGTRELRKERTRISQLFLTGMVFTTNCVSVVLQGIYIETHMFIIHIEHMHIASGVFNIAPYLISISFGLVVIFGVLAQTTRHPRVQVARGQSKQVSQRIQVRRQKVLAHYREGLGLADIAKKLGASASTIAKDRKALQSEGLLQ